MRQGGMKPKNHSSGVYWVRANANSGGGSSKGEKEEGGMIGGIVVFLAVVTIISVYFI